MKRAIVTHKLLEAGSENNKSYCRSLQTNILWVTILGLRPRDETAMSVYKTIENGPQVLHKNRVKFPKAISLHCSVRVLQI